MPIKYEESAQALLADISQEAVDFWCDIQGLATMNKESFRSQFADYSVEGLTSLLTAISNTIDHDQVNISKASSEGIPFPKQNYKYPQALKSRAYLAGYAQLHWRGMTTRDEDEISEQKGVHCDVRFCIGPARVEGEKVVGEEGDKIMWVLAGGQQKIIRGLSGESDPKSSKPTQLLAVVKPRAEEASERIKQSMFKAADTQPEHEEWRPSSMETQRNDFDATVKVFKPDQPWKWEKDGLKKAKGLLRPLQGFWLEPGDLPSGNKDWQYLQLIAVFKWLPGVQRKDVHEYFIWDSSWPDLDGRYAVRNVGKYWLWMRPEDQMALNPEEHEDEGYLMVEAPKENGDE